jgi:cytochrome c oxidase subunit 4
MSGHISPKSMYYTIFGSLMALTAVTISVAFIDLGTLNFPVALAIAILKATLVILFFMHVKYSSQLTNLICGTAFFFLNVLFGLTLTDYLSRGWFAAPGGGTAGAQLTIGPPAGGAGEEGEPAGQPQAAPEP